MLINPDPNNNLDLNPVQLFATAASFWLLVAGALLITLSLCLWIAESSRKRRQSELATDEVAIQPEGTARSFKVMMWGAGTFAVGIVAIIILYSMRI